MSFQLMNLIVDFLELCMKIPAIRVSEMYHKSLIIKIINLRLFYTNLLDILCKCIQHFLLFYYL